MIMAKSLFQLSQITAELLNFCRILTFFKFKTNPRIFRPNIFSWGLGLEFVPENTLDSGTINIVFWHVSQKSMNSTMKSFNFWQWIGFNGDTYNFNGSLRVVYPVYSPNIPVFTTYLCNQCMTFLIVDIVALVLVLLPLHLQRCQRQ